MAGEASSGVDASFLRSCVELVTVLHCTTATHMYIGR